MIRVGPAGWSYADWEGIVYPRPKPRGFHPLRHLARFVGCVELNASFYALPRADHARRWVELVGEWPDFRFLVKLHRDFTHGDPLLAGPELAGAFQDAIAPLAGSGKLAALLAQFPVSFRRTPQALRRVERVRELFPGPGLVLELRHRSWFEPDGLRVLSELGGSVAAIDLPAARDHPPADVVPPGPLGYLRLHGRNAAAWFDRAAGRDQRYDYLYGPSELEEIVARVRTLAGAKDETYVVTNNHFSGKAVTNALEILSSLRGAPVAAPPELLRAFPRLAMRTRTEGQRDLFES